MIKKYWKEALIVVLMLFSISKCTSSCSRGNKLKQGNIELNAKDSVISVLNDSIKNLNSDIEVYEEKLNGLHELTKAKDEAINKIVDAKKNINVKLNTKKN